MNTTNKKRSGKHNRKKDQYSNYSAKNTDPFSDDNNGKNEEKPKMNQLDEIRLIIETKISKIQYMGSVEPWEFFENLYGLYGKVFSALDKVSTAYQFTCLNIAASTAEFNDFCLLIANPMKVDWKSASMVLYNIGVTANNIGHPFNALSYARDADEATLITEYLIFTGLFIYPNFINYYKKHCDYASKHGSKVPFDDDNNSSTSSSSKSESSKPNFSPNDSFFNFDESPPNSPPQSPKNPNNPNDPPKPPPPPPPPPQGPPGGKPPLNNLNIPGNNNGYPTLLPFYKWTSMFDLHIPQHRSELYVDSDPHLGYIGGKESCITVKLERFPIFEVMYENILTHIMHSEPQFFGSRLCDNIYFVRTDKFIELPASVIYEAALFWHGRDRTLANYILSQKDIIQILNDTTTGEPYRTECAQYGPMIAYLIATSKAQLYDPTYSFNSRQLNNTLLCKRWCVNAGVACVGLLIYNAFKIIKRVVNYTRDITTKSISAVSHGFSVKHDFWISPSSISTHMANLNTYVNPKNLFSRISESVSGSCSVVQHHLYSPNMAVTIVDPPTLLRDVVIGPVIEELIRTINPELITGMLIGFEVTVAWLTGSTKNYAPAAAMHSICCLLAKRNRFSSLLPRILLHSSFNLFASFTQGNISCGSFLSSIWSGLTRKQHIFDGYKKYPPDISKLKPLLPERGTIKNRFKDYSMIKDSPSVQYLFGIGDNYYRPTYYAGNYINEKLALTHRMLCKTPVPHNDFLRWFDRFFKKNLHLLLPHTFRTKIESLPHDEYIATSNAMPGVKRTLIRVKSEMSAVGFSENHRINPRLCYKWTKRKTFVKVENINHRVGNRKKEKTPRVIQGGEPQYINIMGPYIASLQRHVKRDLNGNSNIIFTSGVANDKCAQKFMEILGHIVEDDIGKFDASIHRQLCKLEYWFLQKMRAPALVLQLFKDNIDKRGITPHGIKYKVDGQRASGDPFTSLFNSILNVMLHIFILCMVTKLPFAVVITKIRMLVQGDDNLLHYPRKWGKIDFRKYMLLLGFDAKALYRTSYIMAEFCSMRLVKCADTYTFCPKIGKLISKFGYFISPPLVNPAVLVRGTVLGLQTTRFIEPLAAIYDHLLKLTSHVEAHPIRREEWQMRLVYSEPNFETKYSISKIYDWDDSLTQLFIKELSSTVLGQDSIGPLFRHLCDVDTAGPADRIHH